MSETPQLSVNHGENIEPIMGQGGTQLADTDHNARLAQVAIGAVIGAVLGVVAGTLARQITVKGVNKPIEGMEDPVNDSAKGINHIIEDVGAIVKSVAEDVSQNVLSMLNVANFDTVGQPHTTVAEVYEQPLVAENKEDGMDWDEQLLGKDKISDSDLKDWKQVAQALGKSETYINQIAAVTEFGQPPIEHVKTAMAQDFSAYKQISLELWQWHQAAKALGKNEADLNQIVEVAISFHHLTHPTPLSEEAVFTMQQNIGAYREKSKPAIASQAIVGVPEEPIQQELAYTLLYKKLQERVRQVPQLKNSSIKEVDIVIVIIALKESVNKDEIEGIIAQSDHLKTWKQSMSEEEFKSKATDYIYEVHRNAISLRQNILKQRALLNAGMNEFI